MNTPEPTPFVLQYWGLIVYGTVYVVALGSCIHLRRRNSKFFSTFILGMIVWFISWFIDITSMYQFHKAIATGLPNDFLASFSVIAANLCVILNLIGWIFVIISLFRLSNEKPPSA